MELLGHAGLKILKMAPQAPPDPKSGIVMDLSGFPIGIMPFFRSMHLRGGGSCTPPRPRTLLFLLLI